MAGKRVKSGTSTSGFEMSPRAKRRRAAERRAEEKSWEEQNGRVLIKIGGYEIYAKSAARKDLEAARAALRKIIGHGDSATRTDP